MVAPKRLKYLAMREPLFVKFYKTIDSKKSNCLLLNISIDVKVIVKAKIVNVFES